MKKRLSFITFLSFLSLSYLHSPLNAAGTDTGEVQEVCGLEQNNQIDLSAVEFENQEDLTPYITFSNETKQNTKILEALLTGSVRSTELDYIYRIEARDSCKPAIDALRDIIKNNIKLQFTGMKKRNDPKDHQGNASVSAEYQIIIEGEMIPETFWINVSMRKPLFTNQSNVFGSSVEHICNGTFCHEGRTYGFSASGFSGKNTIGNLYEWKTPSFKLIIHPNFSEYATDFVTGVLYVKDKMSKTYNFEVKR